MSKQRKRKSTLSVLLYAGVISAMLTMLLNPLMKLIYPLEYIESIRKYSGEFGLDKYLVMGIISAESAFCADAESHKSARGLMQLKDETALWCIHNLNLDADEKSIYDPDTNIRIGCAYMRYLTDLYGGNTMTAVAAYNAGLGNVNKWLSDKRYSDGGTHLKSIPFSETEAYLEKVAKRTEIYKKLYP